MASNRPVERNERAKLCANRRWPLQNRLMPSQEFFSLYRSIDRLNLPNAKDSSSRSGTFVPYIIAECLFWLYMFVVFAAVHTAYCTGKTFYQSMRSVTKQPSGRTKLAPGGRDSSKLAHSSQWMTPRRVHKRCSYNSSETLLLANWEMYLAVNRRNPSHFTTVCHQSICKSSCKAFSGVVATTANIVLKWNFTHLTPV